MPPESGSNEFLQRIMALIQQRFGGSKAQELNARFQNASPERQQQFASNRFGIQPGQSVRQPFHGVRAPIGRAHAPTTPAPPSIPTNARPPIGRARDPLAGFGTATASGNGGPGRARKTPVSNATAPTGRNRDFSNITFRPPIGRARAQ